MKQTSYSFRTFSRKFWLLYVVLCGILVLGVMLFCVIFHHKLYDSSAWASMISGIITYISSSILGVFVFYHSWVQNVRQAEIQEEIEDISVIIDLKGNYLGEQFNPYDEEEIKKRYPRSSVRYSNNIKESEETKKYVQISITNINHKLPMYMEIVGLLYVNDHNELVKAAPIKTRYAVNIDNPIDYKEEIQFYVGIPREVFEQERYKKHGFMSCFVVMKMKNMKSRVKYGCIYCLAGRTFCISKMLMSEEKYSMYKEKNIGLSESDLSFIDRICSNE